MQTDIANLIILITTGQVEKACHISHIMRHRAIHLAYSLLQTRHRVGTPLAIETSHEKEISMTTVASPFTAALIAVILTSASPLSAAPLKRGEDPEFRAAWRALQTKERRKHGIHTSAHIARSPSTSFPVEAIGNSARDVCAAVRNRISYTSDTVDTWQTAGESWSRQKGDCEDSAVAVRDICLAKGISADVHVFYSQTSDAGHAVTIGRSAAGLWMSSNGSFERTTSLAAARNTIVRRHGWTNEKVASYKSIGSGKRLVKTSLR